MIGIDTNVLVRHLTQDDLVQAEAAGHFLSLLSEEKPGFVSLVTAVELSWVLQRAYKAAPSGVMEVIAGLLRAREIIVQSPDLVAKAIDAVKSSSAEFSDAVISLLGTEAGCEYTITFDRRACALPGMRLLGTS